jgi:hypothetical protein
MDDLKSRFGDVSRQGLDRAERCLALAGSEPCPPELFAETFRALHTINGETWFLKLPRVEHTTA